MARQSTTFVKRQKELARMEKQRAKAARKQQRKAEKLAGIPSEQDDPQVQSTTEDSVEQQEGNETL